jgi:redox-sensitive bicupin YhaK (pirin superfamily)
LPASAIEKSSLKKLLRFCSSFRDSSVLSFVNFVGDFRVYLMRGSIHLFPVTKTGHFDRVIGTVDFLGAGTNHSLAEVNPFVLFDDAVMDKAGVPPFGLHPHRGLHVVSLIWSGCIASRMGHQEKAVLCQGPTAVSLFAGRGMSHEEATHTAEFCSLQQVIMRLPESSTVKPAWAMSSKAAFKTVSTGADVLVAVGSLFGIDAGLPDTGVKSNIVMAKLQPGCSLTLPVFPGGCFVYPVGDSSVRVEETDVPTKQLAVLEDFSGEIVVQNTGKADARFVFANAERINEPWVKLLTQNGFLIAKDKDEALRQEQLSKQLGLDKYGRE